MIGNYVKYVLAAIVLAGLVYAALLGMSSFTPEAFVAISAGLLAVAFERFAWLKTDWDKLTSGQKQLVMGLFMAILVYGAFGLSCLGELAAFPCTGQGAIDALFVLLIAIGVNQGVHRLIRQKA